MTYIMMQWCTRVYNFNEIFRIPASMAASRLSSSEKVEVVYLPRGSRPGEDNAFADEDDEVTVLSIGKMFVYLVPNLDNVLGLPIRHVKIRGYSRHDGEEIMYDVFIRNCSSLDRLYPAEMIVKDVAVIKVLISK